MNTLIEPLIKRKIFASEEEAIQELIHDYVLRQIADLKQEIQRFEEKYGMNFHQFGQYLHERSALLSEGKFSPEQRISLNQTIMQEEDDWLDWKAYREILESWLGLRQEISA